MAKKGGNPQNLLPGGVKGNRGGGVPLVVREAKQEFLDGILNAKGAEYDAPDYQTVRHALKAKVVEQALHGNGYMAQWLLEMQYGKPNAKTEVVLGNAQVTTAVADALFKAGIPKEKAVEVMTILHESLGPDA